MFFNRICGFAAETGILLGFWLTGQSGPTSCLAEALQDSDGADYTSIAAARWIEQSLRGVIVRAAKRLE